MTSTRLLAPRVLLGRDYAAALEETADGLAEHGQGPLRLPGRFRTCVRSGSSAAATARGPRRSSSNDVDVPTVTRRCSPRSRTRWRRPTRCCRSTRPAAAPIPSWCCTPTARSSARCIRSTGIGLAGSWSEETRLRGDAVLLGRAGRCACWAALHTGSAHRVPGAVRGRRGARPDRAGAGHDHRRVATLLDGAARARARERPRPVRRCEPLATRA